MIALPKPPDEPKPWAKAPWLTPKLDAILTPMDGITAQRWMAVMEKYLVGKGTAKELEELSECGIADAALDVNDPAEAGALVAELHALSIKYHCPLLNIIHVNPASESKTRGHMGSQLERKSETSLRLEKDTSGVTAVWADKSRRAPACMEAGKVKVDGTGGKTKDRIFTRAKRIALHAMAMLRTLIPG